jgi:uncharacterized protein YqgC (DUF456 family)
MEIALVFVTLTLIFVGMFGVFLPMVPGPLVAWLALLGCHAAWPEGPVGTPTLIFTLVLVAVAKGFDLLASLWGARWYGASWAGAWGALIGGLVFTLLGFLTGVGVVIGAIFGPALGAFLAEWLFGKTWREAMRAGWGTFMGFVASIVFNLFVCGVMLALFVMLCIAELLK